MKKRSYYRIENMLNLYNEEDNIKILNNFKNNKTEKQICFNFIKRIFVFHWKVLRDFLKEDYDIKLFYPREIFKVAEEKLIIKNAELWIKYIDLVNELLQTKSFIEQNKIVDKILEVYIKEGLSLKDFYSSILLKREDDFILEYDNKDFIPSYSSQDLLISEKSYKILLDFIKNNTEINKVWVFGSRVIGNYRKASDIDLIIDSPFLSFDSLCQKFKDLKIPYRVDCKNIYDKQDDCFIKQNLKNACLIYDKNSFTKKKIKLFG